MSNVDTKTSLIAGRCLFFIPIGAAIVVTFNVGKHDSEFNEAATAWPLSCHLELVNVSTPLTDAQVREVEAEVGMNFPIEYLEFARFRNGGELAGDDSVRCSVLDNRAAGAVTDTLLLYPLLRTERAATTP